jgi:hypothetical protein
MQNAEGRRQRGQCERGPEEDEGQRTGSAASVATASTFTATRLVSWAHGSGHGHSGEIIRDSKKYTSTKEYNLRRRNKPTLAIPCDRITKSPAKIYVHLKATRGVAPHQRYASRYLPSNPRRVSTTTPPSIPPPIHHHPISPPSRHNEARPRRHGLPAAQEVSQVRLQARRRRQGGQGGHTGRPAPAQDRQPEMPLLGGEPAPRPAQGDFMPS